MLPCGTTGHHLVTLPLTESFKTMETDGAQLAADSQLQSEVSTTLHLQLKVQLHPLLRQTSCEEAASFRKPT